MRGIIKKILSENFNDFGWIGDTPAFEPGKNFTEEDICFNEEKDGCKIIINDNEIKFKLSYDEWSEYVDVFDGSHDYYLRPVMFNDGEYLGDGDYYDFDIDEFNYFTPDHHYMSNKQINRINKILRFVDSNERVENFLNNQNMWELMGELRYPPLQSYYEELADNFLGVIGYTVQKNRWVLTSRTFNSLVKDTGSNWYMPDYYSIELTVPMSKVRSLMSLYNVKTLSDLLDQVSYPLTSHPWGDSFDETWDTSGG